MSVSEKSLEDHLAKAVDNPNIFDRIPQDALVKGLKGMADALNNPQRETARNQGRSI